MKSEKRKFEKGALCMRREVMVAFFMERGGIPFSPVPAGTGWR